jgi:hypothetical protein
MDDISKIKSILELYKNISYFDLYGTQFMVFILLTIVEILALIILSFKRYSQYYKNNWDELRCDPTIMPFAGFINKPDGEGIVAYTQNNYNYCNQHVVNKKMEKELEPFYKAQEHLNTTSLSSNANMSTMVSNNNETITNTEEAMDTGASKISKTFSLLNYGYTIFMSFFSNITDIMTSLFQFSLTGLTWSTMFTKVLMMAVKVMLVIFFVVAIIPLMPFWWIIPFILFVVVTVIVFKFGDYVDIITSSMSKVEPFSLIKPKKTSLCFDKKTFIQTVNGYKTIQRIRVGDVLQGGETVTAKFKTIAPSVMFNLNGIIVSGDHYVFKDKWIQVKRHPESVAFHYQKKFLYCLNTTSKRIKIGNYEFMDWDELDKKGEKIVGDYLESRGRKRDEIHVFMDRGYHRNLLVKTNRGYKKICRLEPGDMCYGSKILAKVTIKGDDLVQKHRHLKLYNVVTDTGFFKNKRDYNFIIDNLFYMS